MKKYSWLFWVLLTFLACNKEDDSTPAQTCGQELNLQQGVFIVNEGNISSGVGTVDFYDASMEERLPNLFQSQNCERELGSLAQSIYFDQDKAYIVLHNSDKIEVVHQSDFRSFGTIRGLELPRHFLPVNDQKAYVSQWGEGLRDQASIAVVDLQSLEVIKTIPTGAGTEHLLRVGDDIYAVNEGALLNDSLLLILDTEQDIIKEKITLPAYNPHSLQLDRNGDLWVLCRGYTNWDLGQFEEGALLQIRNKQIVQSFAVPNFSRRLKIDSDGTTLYFILEQGGIARHPIDATTLDLTPFLTGQFYNLGVHPGTQQLYATDYLDFSSEGLIHIFSQSGVLQKQIPAGIGPSELWFLP